MTIIIPLLIGGLLYYIFCPNVYYVKMIDYYTGLNMHILWNKHANMVTELFRNHFFDCLWAYSFTNALYLTFNNDDKALMKSCIISILVGGLGEITQRMGMVYGTFDMLDILYEILGAVSAALTIKIFRRKKT